MTAAVHCPSCKAATAAELWNPTEWTACPVCGTEVRTQLFPALYRPVARGQNAEPLVIEDEASCFFHPQKRAAVPCYACGRFLCTLCDCQLNDHHYCPACLQTGKQKGRIKNLDNQRTLFDSISLGLAVLPAVLVFTLYFTIITAPLALYVAIRYWRAPMSIVRQSRFRFVIAIVLSTAQICGWGVALYFIFASRAFHG